MLYENELEDNLGFDTVDFDSLLDDLAANEGVSVSPIQEMSSISHSPPSSVMDYEGDTSDEDESTEDHLDKRRRTSTQITASHQPPQRKRKIKIPRFLVQDIRKCYTKMFQNVMNSGDFNLLYGFLETYYASNPQHSTTKYIKGHAEKVFTMNFFGMNEVAKYWYCIMNMSPDNILMLTDSTIQHTTGKVMSNLHKEGTHIYVDPPQAASYYAPYIWVEEKYDKEHLYVRDSRTNDIIVGRPDGREVEEDVHTVERRKQVMRDIMSSVDNVVSHLPLRNPPQPVGADGTLVIHTDENKRITKMELSIIY